MTTTTDNNNLDNEYEPFRSFFGDGLMYDLGKGPYKNKLKIFRELSVNGLDQYEHPDLANKVRPIVKIQLDPLRKKVIVIDYATGIEDMKDFLRIGTQDVSGFTGKQVGNKVSTRMTINERIVGKKHIGKAASIYGSETGTVEFFSNDGKAGYYLRAELVHGWKKFPNEIGDMVPFKRMSPTDAKPERGLMVVISAAYPEMTDIKRVEKELLYWLGLRIARGARIHLEDVTKPHSEHVLKKPEDLDTVENSHTEQEKLALTLASVKNDAGGSIRIRTCFKTCENPEYFNVTMYCSQIRVTEVHYDYKVTGWYENPALSLNTGRDDIVDDDDVGVWRENVEKIDAYIGSHFEKIEKGAKDEKPRKESPSMNKIANNIQQIIAKQFGRLAKEVQGIKTDCLTKGPQTENIVEDNPNVKEKRIVEKEPFMTNVEFRNGGGNTADNINATTKGPGRKLGTGLTETPVETPGGARDKTGQGEDSNKKVVVESEKETNRNAYRVKTELQVERKVATKPQIRVIVQKDERNPSPAFVADDSGGIILIIVNSRYPVMVRAWDDMTNRSKRFLPLLVRALLDWNFANNPDMSRDKYNEMFDQTYRGALEVEMGLATATEELT